MAIVAILSKQINPISQIRRTPNEIRGLNGLLGRKHMAPRTPFKRDSLAELALGIGRKDRVKRWTQPGLEQNRAAQRVSVFGIHINRAWVRVKGLGKHCS